MEKHHFFCRLEFLVFSQHYWALTAGFGFPRTSVTNNSPIPVETLLTSLPEAYSIRDRFKTTQLSKDWGARHGQWVFFCCPEPPIQIRSQFSPRTHKCMAGSHLIASCPDFLFFTFVIYFLSASCHVFSACKRQDAICIHKLPGDFYWTVKVTSLDTILPLSALGWHAKLKLIRQDVVHPSLAFGFHAGKARPQARNIGFNLLMHSNTKNLKWEKFLDGNFSYRKIF